MATGDEEIIVWSYNAMARVAFDACKFDQVLRSGTAAKDLNIRFDDENYTAHLLALMGGSYTSLGFYEQGKNILQQSRSYAEKIENINCRHNRLGIVYSFIATNLKEDNKKQDSVLHYLKMSYKEYESIKNIPQYQIGLRMAENNLGDYYIEIKQYELAKNFSHLWYK